MSSVLLPLFLTLVVQILVSGSSLTAAVLAPLAAPDLGVPVASLGYFVTLIYAAASISGLASGPLIGRLGALGTMQVTLCCGAAAQLALATGALWMLPVAAVLSGVSLGPTTPASSAILVGTSQTANRNLVFSLKQTGVPGGFALAALVLPPLAFALGWRAAAAVSAAALIAASLALTPWRDRFDAGRTQGGRASLRGLFVDPLRRVWTSRDLRRLGLASFAFAGLQGALGGYLIVFLTHDTPLDLIAAAGLLAMAQVAGVVGRVVWGIVADRTGRPGLLLALLAFAMSAMGLACGTGAPYLPVPVLAVLCVLFGGTAMAWNGVFLSEVARFAPDGGVADATGAVGLFTFGGAAVMPAVFATVVLTTDSFATAYALASLLPAAVGIALLRNARGEGIPGR